MKKFILIFFILFSSFSIESSIVISYGNLNKYSNYVLEYNKNYGRAINRITENQAKSIVISSWRWQTREFPIEILLAQQATESAFVVRASNNYGALGVAQVVYRLWTWHTGFSKIISSKEDLYNPSLNIKAQVMILEYFHKRTYKSHGKTFKRYSGQAKRYVQKIQIQEKVIRAL